MELSIYFLQSSLYKLYGIAYTSYTGLFVRIKSRKIVWWPGQKKISIFYNSSSVIRMLNLRENWILSFIKPCKVIPFLLKQFIYCVIKIKCYSQVLNNTKIITNSDWYCSMHKICDVRTYYFLHYPYWTSFDFVWTIFSCSIIL